MQRKGRADLIAVLTICLVLWASAFAGIRLGLRSFGPGELALLRFVIASLSLLVYALITRLPLPAVRDLPMLFLMGFLGFTVYHVGLNAGETVVPAGAASFIIASVPVFSTLLAVIFLRERLTALGWIGVGVSFFGVAIISIGTGTGLKFEPAALFIVLAALGESIYFVIQKPFLTRYTGLQLTTYTIWTGTIFMMVYLPGLIGELGRASLASTLAAAYLGVFPAAIGYVLWSIALSRADVSRVTSTLNLSPIISLIIAFLVLAEVPTALSVVGGVITVAGVILLNTLGKRTAQPLERRARSE
ncbi:MAG TPA: DMT family transporter [Spirochaetia bacterium]|nr:DMT family transporter [Spirochaetia bacterium]